MRTKPSDFTSTPWDSVFQNSESETVATNIMKILERLGDEWQELTWEQYKDERLKDGNFSEVEGAYFDNVIGYCKSADTAKLFSKSWREE